LVGPILFSTRRAAAHRPDGGDLTGELVPVLKCAILNVDECYPNYGIHAN
jgi:hypothetical protein